MVKLIFHPDAKTELREATAYYRERRVEVGQEFLSEVRHLLNNIRRNPLRCGFISPSHRCCRVKKFPYGVVYRATEVEIFIAAVMHYKRKPGYWKKRL